MAEAVSQAVTAPDAMTEPTSPRKERRRHSRLPGSRRISFFANSGLSKEIQAELLDRSPQGIGCTCGERLAPGTILIFERTAGLALPQRGRVIWVMHQAGGCYRVGIQFLDGE